jgi:hypothetical protein
MQLDAAEVHDPRETRGVIDVDFGRAPEGERRAGSRSGSARAWWASPSADAAEARWRVRIARAGRLLITTQ